MKKDKFDDRYRYYLYATDKVDECINNGIEISPGYQLSGTLILINSYIQNNDLDELIEEHYKDMNTFIIVRIPTYYMGWRHRNGVKESFVPMIKNFVDKDTLLTRTFVIPELIYAVYNKKENKFINNNKYTAFYNPNGLCFCDEQIGNMFGIGCYELYQEAFGRREIFYEDLKEEDISERVWDKTVKYYRSSKLKRRILNINKNKRGRR